MADAEPTAKSPDAPPSEQVADAPEKVADEAGVITETAETPAGEPQEKPQSTPAEDTKEETTAAADAPVEADTATNNAEGNEGQEEAAANGESASAKKSGNGKRKSTGASDGRSRKSNKRKSAARITQLHAKPGEYYFARLKKFSPWPAIVCDEEMLPESLLATRPVTTKQPDGTYREPYSDEGKRAHERTFPIMYLHTNEFSWIPNTDLTPLDPEACVNPTEKGKSKALLAAYEVATEKHDLQYFKDMLSEHQRAVEEEIEAQEAKEAAKAAKQDKKKRKSMDVAEDVEMEDSGTTKRKGTKKRKKDVDSEGEGEKAPKTPKTTTKLKLTTPKAPADESGKKTSKAQKSKGTGKKGNKAASDEEAAETPKEPDTAAVQQDAKAKREKEILYLRYKLQKGFLSRDQAPGEDEMKAMSNYIAKLESYSDLEVSVIRTTKIHKVLKAIIRLNSIPKDEEFKFRDRTVNILKKWKQLLESDLPSAAGPSEAKPAANGVNQEKKSEEKNEEKLEDKVEKSDDKSEEKSEENAEATGEEKPDKSEEGDQDVEKAAPEKDLDTPMPDASDEKAANEDTKEKEEAETPAKESEPETA